MSKVEEIVELIGKKHPGLLDRVSGEDGISKEGLVRKVILISHGKMVRTHQNKNRGAANLENLRIL